MASAQENIRIVRQYATRANLPVLSGQTSQQLAIRQVKLFNNAGGANDLGIIKRQADAGLALNRVLLGAALEDVKTLLSEGPITLFTANDDRLIVGNKRRFGHILINATVVSVAAVYTLEYFNGTIFTTLSAFETWTGGQLALGLNLITFPAPHDWALGGPGLPTDKYNVDITATTFGNGTIDQVWTGELLSFQRATPQNSALEITNVDGNRPLILDSNESIVPYFQTADPLNYVEISYNNTL